MTISKLFLLLGCFGLSGCVETYKLNAVQPGAEPKVEENDRPRIDLDTETAKLSFVVFLSEQCKGLKADAPGPAAKTWTEKNPAANVCVNRISAYAADQCAWITRRQNQVVVTTSLLTEVTALGASAVTAGAIMAHPSNASKTPAGILAASVLANSDKVKGVTTTTVPLKDMLAVGANYAEMVGLASDDLDVIPSPLPTGSMTGGREQVMVGGNSNLWMDLRKDPRMIRLARVHDAVLSLCTGNAIGL